jgi:excisionase family DNA binding protein
MKAAYTVEEAVSICSLGSRSALYRLLDANRLGAVKVGKKTLLLASDIASFLQKLPPKKPRAAAATTFEPIGTITTA